MSFITDVSEVILWKCWSSALFGKAERWRIDPLKSSGASCLLLAFASAFGLGDFKAPHWGSERLFQISVLTAVIFPIPLPLLLGPAILFIFPPWYQITFCLVMALLFAVDTELYFSAQRDLQSSAGDWKNCKVRWSQGPQDEWPLIPQRNSSGSSISSGHNFPFPLAPPWQQRGLRSLQGKKRPVISRAKILIGPTFTDFPKAKAQSQPTQLYKDSEQMCFHTFSLTEVPQVYEISGNPASTFKINPTIRPLLSTLLLASWSKPPSSPLNYCSSLLTALPALTHDTWQSILTITVNVCCICHVFSWSHAIASLLHLK